jgi:hypothetical protein
MEEREVQNAVDIARAILDGSMPLLLGCKRILGPLHRLGLDRDDAFLVFVAVDSETDHLPLDPEEKKLWNAQALIEKEKEIAKSTAWAKGLKRSPRTACETVIKRFGAGGNVVTLIEMQPDETDADLRAVADAILQTLNPAKRNWWGLYELRGQHQHDGKVFREFWCRAGSVQIWLWKLSHEQKMRQVVWLVDGQPVDPTA